MRASDLLIALDHQRRPLCNGARYPARSVETMHFATKRIAGGRLSTFVTCSRPLSISLAHFVCEEYFYCAPFQQVRPSKIHTGSVGDLSVFA